MTTFGLVLDGNQPKLLLQRVPEAKAAKNRMHLYGGHAPGSGASGSRAIPS